MANIKNHYDGSVEKLLAEKTCSLHLQRRKHLHLYWDNYHLKRLGNILFSTTTRHGKGIKFGSLKLKIQLSSRVEKGKRTDISLHESTSHPTVYC